jgi:hypothetical protein
MTILFKVLVLVFAFMVVESSMGEVFDCHDSHDAACEEDCVCVCHSVPTTAPSVESLAPVFLKVQRIDIPGSQCVEMLLVPDVYRPPIFA